MSENQNNYLSWFRRCLQPAPEEVCFQILKDLRAIFLSNATHHNPVKSRMVLFELSMMKNATDMKFQSGEKTNVHLFSTYIKTVVEDLSFFNTEKIVVASQPKKASDSEEVQDDNVFTKDNFQPAVNAFIEYHGIGADWIAKDLFTDKAFDAAFALSSLFTLGPVNLRNPPLLPEDYFRLGGPISHHTGLPSDLEDRWLMFLHLLGWQQLSKYPIRAKRFIRIGKDTISFGDLDHLQDQLFDSWLKERLGNDFDTKALHFFGSDLCQDINMASVYAIDFILSGGLREPKIDTIALGRKLEKLLPGHSDAGEYQNTVYQILNYVFSPSLQDGAKEEQTDSGRERIDIVYANRAEDGYFHELRMAHEIKCPYVFFECKNYSSDISNEEFAQLYSRLTEKRGKVGFLVCRKINDQTKIRKRCKDYYNNHGVHILILEDTDLLNMIKRKASGDIKGLWTILHEKFRTIVLNQ
jgi:hypothetical protein